MNELLKIFNYGQTDYEFVVSITNKTCSDSIQQKRYMNKSLTPYQININKFSRLIELMEIYAEKFPRFIKSFSKECKSDKYYADVHKNKDGEIGIHIRGHAFIINGYIIDKAFFSYIIQAERNIFELFNCTIYKKYKLFSIKNIRDIFKVKKQSDGHNVWLDAKYKNIKVYNKKKDCEEKHDIQILNGYAFINNERYYIHNLKYMCDGWLILEKFDNHNHYKEFKMLLAQYFESVNVYNDGDFDEYLNDEVQKLMRIDFDQELKQLQS